MKRLLPMAALLGACEGTPLAPDPQPALRASSIATVSARNQVVTLQFTSGDLAQASFKARFNASTSPGGAAQMDGAILVVSAVDGPMPQIGGESLAIDISRASLTAAGLVQFEGTGTVSDGRVVRDTYPISGSARPSASDPDYIVWDIVGGNVGGNEWEVHLEAIGKITAPKD